MLFPNGLFFSLHTFQCEVETSEPVSRERICPALQNDGRRLIALHDLGHDGNEDVLVAVVVDAISQGKIDSIILALAGTNVLAKAEEKKITPINIDKKSFRGKYFFLYKFKTSHGIIFCSLLDLPSSLPCPGSTLHICGS